MLDITETTEGSRWVVRAEGELDLSGVPQLRRVLKHPWPVPDVTVDLAGVTFIDSTGMQFLIESQREAEARGGRLELRNPSGAVRATLRISGVLPLLRLTSE